jgi:hypothetical protein
MALAGEERMEALTGAIARNVWRGAEPGDAATLARIALAQDAHLAAQPMAQLAEGDIRFLPARDACA